MTEQPNLFDWTPPPALPSPARRKAFNGPDYDAGRDYERLRGQLLRVFNLMKDAKWRTLGEIAAVTCDPEASISAQLRHLRKKKYGAHTLEKHHEGGGLYRYRLIVNEGFEEGNAA